jgi:hypothetical protein
MDPWVIAGGIVAIVAVGLFISRNRSLRSETSVGPLLKQLDNNYTVLTGSIIQGDQGMIRLDYTVISPYGVFIIKECREPGRVEVRLKREEWRVSGGGSKKLYNPVWDIRKVANKLEQLVGKYPYIPLVVFTRARLTGDNDFNILEADKLIGHIQSFRDLRVADDQQEKIVGILS